MDKDKCLHNFDGINSRPTAPTQSKTDLVLLIGGGYITLIAVLASYLAEAADRSIPEGWLPVTLLVVFFGINLYLYFAFFKRNTARHISILLQIALSCAGTLLSGDRGNISNLYFIVIPMIVLAFNPAKSLALGLIALASLLTANLALFDLGEALIYTLTQAGGFLFFGIVSYALVQQRTDRRRAEVLLKELEETHSRLKTYSLQAEELAVEKERNRLAREIHDNLGHYLVALTMQLQVAEKTIDGNPAKAAEALNSAERLARDSLSAVRDSVSALRKPPMDVRPLSTLIEALLKDLNDDGFDAELKIHGEEIPLSGPIKTALFRTVQEGLTNVRKHSNADKVSVTISYQTDNVAAETLDNGSKPSNSGTDENNGGPKSGFGLLGLKERLSLLNGSLRYGFEQSENKGFLLSAAIPLPAEEQRRVVDE